MSLPALVHLVWAPLGPEPFGRFLKSLRDHPPGLAHRLVLVFKEFRDPAHRAPWDRLAAGVDHDAVIMPGTVLDLAAYRRVAADLQAPRYCFTNSAAVALADGWMATLDSVLSGRGTGLVGASGSWESAYTAALPWQKPIRRLHFPPFPNPHIRTNAFMLERDLLLDLDWPDVGADKAAALRLESGRRSLTRQVRARGLEAVVVGRDGRTHQPDEWPVSRTFRSGDQEDLLVADNRTVQYAEATGARRAELARFAWG